MLRFSFLWCFRFNLCLCKVCNIDFICCLLRKAVFCIACSFLPCLNQAQEKFFITSRCSTTPALRASVGRFLSRAFAARCAHCTAKSQLKTRRWTRRYIGQESKSYSFGKIEKAKAKAKAQVKLLKGCSFRFYASEVLVFLANWRMCSFCFLLRLVWIS